MSIQIVRKNETTRRFELSIADLEAILSKNEIKDREIVVISIAGAFRKGKSFMLNFFLKYLDERVIKTYLIKFYQSHLSTFSIKETRQESNGLMTVTSV